MKNIPRRLEQGITKTLDAIKYQVATKVIKEEDILYLNNVAETCITPPKPGEVVVYCGHDLFHQFDISPGEFSDALKYIYENETILPTLPVTSHAAKEATDHHEYGDPDRPWQDWFPDPYYVTVVKEDFELKARELIAQYDSTGEFFGRLRVHFEGKKVYVGEPHPEKEYIELKSDEIKFLRVLWDGKQIKAKEMSDALTGGREQTNNKAINVKTGLVTSLKKLGPAVAQCIAQDKSKGGYFLDTDHFFITGKLPD